MDWSIITGLAMGLGLPTLTGLILVVRMENRVTQLESAREADQRWRETVTVTLGEISGSLNQLIGRDYGKK